MKTTPLGTKALTTRLMILNILILTILTLILYGYALRLPFFYDDLPITTWAFTHQWEDLIQNPEGGYFRPIATAIHMVGLMLPVGIQQVTLHLVNLVCLVVGAIMIQKVCLLCSGHRLQALSAGILYVTFPFFGTTVPWITAMSHLLVVIMVALAAYSAIKAQVSGRYERFFLALGLIFISTFVHESGAVAGFIVGGILLSQQLRKKWLLIALGMVGVSLISVLLRPSNLAPSLSAGALSSAADGWYAKGMFFTQSMLYPIMPFIGWLERRYGWNDFAMISLAAGSLVVILGSLVVRDRENLRWILPSLVWWGVGALPAFMAFNYAALFVAPRLYALGAAGSVMLWSGLIVRLPGLRLSGWRRASALGILLVGVIAPGVVYVNRQRDLHTTLADLYRDVVTIVSDGDNHPIGFVNLPYHVSWKGSMYPLIHDGVVFVPWYSNVGEFMRVNTGQNWGDFTTAIYGPVIQETDPFLGFGGSWLDSEAMYAYAQQYQTIQLTHLNSDPSRLVIRDVGSVSEGASLAGNAPLVEYEGGPRILSALVEETDGNELKLTILWQSLGPVGAEIFVHVYDQSGNLVAQADGPALSGLVPLWVWQSDHTIRDVRYISIPSDVPARPYTIGVGIYNGEGRFPALMAGQRATGDAAIVATIE